MTDRREGHVFLVEDDAPLRTALGRLLQEIGYRVDTFASAEEFLQAPDPEECCCLLLDVRLPGLSGPALQELLLEREASRFIVFMTGHGDVPIAVEAMKKGAVDFLIKPVDEETLLAAVEKALSMCRTARARIEDRAAAASALEKLTPRELEVLSLVVEGLPNKIIAARLGIAVQTVKIHRGRVMAKMNADSAVELARLVEKAKRSGSKARKAGSGDSG